ncbi:MAG: DUF4136 domain-containing protein [Bacteroidales bacterium]
MKKLFFALFAISLFVACEKDPDLDKVQDEYLVYTNYDKSADFQSYKTFYVPDSILVINNADKATYLTGTDAQKVINAYVSNMTNRGYSRTLTKADADLGIQVSYVENTNYFLDYAGDDWWLGYPYYWTPGYWFPDYYGDWYYPYPIVYSYSTGSLLTDMIDLKSVKNSTDSKPTVVWNSFISGLLYGNSLNTNKTVNAINQAFKQSGYIKTTSSAK